MSVRHLMAVTMSVGVAFVTLLSGSAPVEAATPASPPCDSVSAGTGERGGAAPGTIDLDAIVLPVHCGHGIPAYRSSRVEVDYSYVTVNQSNWWWPSGWGGRINVLTTQNQLGGADVVHLKTGAGHVCWNVMITGWDVGQSPPWIARTSRFQDSRNGCVTVK